MGYLQTNQLSVVNFGEQRKALRYEVVQLIAITEKGTGRVLDINQDGLSIGCLYPHQFPDEMKIDILGANGVFIKELTVRKCWENGDESIFFPEPFEILVGFEFSQLTGEKSRELSKLIRHIEVEDKYSSCQWNRNQLPAASFSGS